MGYLKYTFDKYYYSNSEKERTILIKDFRNKIWNSLPYIKIEKSFRYKVVDGLVEQKYLEILNTYSVISYKVLMSRYNINKLDKEELIKARINSNYGKYFDKEVYLHKQYYKLMANFKNIYFKYINNEIENLIDEIDYNLNEVNIIKLQSENKKINITWEEYKGFIDSCFDKIFNNYIPIENKINNGEFTPNRVLDWDEDNYILCYVNKSLNGYLKNYIKEIRRNKAKNKYKYCIGCGKRIEVTNNKTQYCKACAREINIQKTIENRKRRNCLK